jgi:hypothetical protein
MKMRKLLPLILLAVGSLFLLSGCDAMLDAIFQNDVINLDVWVLGSTHADFTIGSSYENLQVMDSSFTVIQNVNQYYSSYDGMYIHYYFTVNRLKDGTYYLTTYYNGPITGYRGSSSNIYDSNGNYVGGFITFPDKSLGDSSGHTANIRMLAP